MESSALHVLVVAGSPEERLTLRRLLAQAAPGAYTITEADRADQVRSHCRANPPDCVLLAVPLPDRDARRFLADLRAASDVPVVLLTDVDHEALALDALQQGAQDYLVTASLTPLRLHLTLQRAVASARRPRERDHTLALLTALLDTLPVGVAVLDQELRVIRANTALATLLGAPAVALVRQPLPALWPTLAGPLTPLCAQALATGQPAGPLEVVAASPAGAGEPQAWQVGLYPLAMPGTGGPGLALVVGELTAQLEARTALALSEQRLRQALDAGGLVAWEWDIRAGIMTFSGAICDVLGFPPDRLTRTLDELAQMVYPPDRSGYAQALAAALRDGGPYQVRFRMQRDDQRLIWVEVRGVAQHDAGGQLVRAFGVTRDISAEQQRAAAQALHLAISQALCPAHDVAATLQTLVRLPLPDLAEYCAIYLGDTAGHLQRVVVAAGNPAESEPLSSPPSGPPAGDGTGLLEAVWHSGVAQVLPAVPPDLVSALGPGAPRTALLIPIKSQGHRLGVLVLGHTMGAEPYDAADLELAQFLAWRAAAAIRRAELQAAAQAAQQAAAEALARLEALITSAPNGVAYLDRELRYVLVNPALAAMNGRPPAAHLGHTPAEVLPPGLSAAVEPLLRRVLATGTPVCDLELPGQAAVADPAPRDWLMSFFPVPAPAGGVAGVGVTVTDITPSKRTAAALRASEERFRLLAEHAQDIIYRVQLLPSVRLEYLSPAVERLTGYPREALYADPALGYQLMHPDDLHVIEEQYPVPTILTEPVTVRWRHRDGHTGWAEMHSWVVSTADSPTLVVEGIARDITARQQAEEALRTSEQNLSALIENTDGKIWSVDTHYRLIVGNALFRRLVSAVLGRAIVAGDCMVALDLPQAALDEWRGYYDRALGGETFSVEEYPYAPPDPRTMDYRFSPIRTAAGQITGVTVFGRDTTERLQAERALRDTERKLGTLFTLLPVGVSIFDAAGGLVYVNPALEQILRMDHARLVAGEHLARPYLRPDGTPRAQEELVRHRVLRDHRAVTNQVNGFVTETGDVVWTSVSGVSVDFPDWRAVLITTDITQRKQAEDALRASELRYRTLFETMAQGVIYYDADGCAITANPAAARILGLAEPQIRGQSVFAPDWHVFHEDGTAVSAADHPLWVALRSGEAAPEAVLGLAAPH
ncbi:MAG: PAS domain S-box protein, partial [Chloroflexales bacterium]|nr:PAS domain S-box protein [Chloroflexales bacterium]